MSVDHRIGRGMPPPPISSGADADADAAPAEHPDGATTLHRHARGPARRGRRRLIALGAVLVLAGTGWVVVFSPLLTVRTVDVVGVHRLSARSVLDAAFVPGRTSLVRLPRGEIADRVERLPDVLRADVAVSYPSTVRITVTERTAAGVLQTDAATWLLVDETGHSFTTVRRRPADLPLLAPAPPVSADVATLSAMAQVAIEVPPAVRVAVATVRAESPTTITLVLRDGRTVVWGASERNADKARVLPALLARPGRTFSVADPDLVWTR